MANSFPKVQERNLSLDGPSSQSPANIVLTTGLKSANQPNIMPGYGKGAPIVGTLEYCALVNPYD